MQVATGKSVLNGIAIGKIVIYKAPKLEISDRLIEDVESELKRFDDARERAIEQQNALYEKALVDAGEDSAEVFSVHAMMLEDDDLLDATNEIIKTQKHTAEYAVKVAFDNQAKVFAEMDDPYMRERAADIYDIEQAVLNYLFGINADALQVRSPVFWQPGTLHPPRPCASISRFSSVSSPKRDRSTVTQRYLRVPWAFRPWYSARTWTKTGTDGKPSSTAIIPAPISSRPRILRSRFGSARRKTQSKRRSYRS